MEWTRCLEDMSLLRKVRHFSVRGGRFETRMVKCMARNENAEAI
jgi:hypothetical protein